MERICSNAISHGLPPISTIIMNLHQHQEPWLPDILLYKQIIVHMVGQMWIWNSGALKFVAVLNLIFMSMHRLSDRVQSASV